jgi:hypothetical protein
MKEEFVDVMTLKQNFGYNKNNKIWAKNTKLILPLALLNKIHRKITYMYSNYEFVDALQKKTLPMKSRALKSIQIKGQYFLE